MAIQEKFKVGDKVKTHDGAHKGVVESQAEEGGHVHVTVKAADGTEFKRPQHDLEPDTTA